MTQKMEDFFNLPPTDVPEVEEDLPSKTKEELLVEAKEIYSSLTTAEKVDFALPTVIGLDTHDSEMDDIASKAVKTFEDLLALGGNVADLHAGKIYEVAGQMLKTALEAKNAKAERKLKMIELQLKKVRAEQIDLEQGNGERRGANGGEFDRNELLKYIVSNKTEKSDK
jgi:hypothetical protein